MKTQHTPGPWKIDGGGNKVSSNSKLIAHVYGHLENGRPSDIAWSIEDRDNARLIGAAPELLAALERAKRVLEDLGSHAPGATRDEIIERMHMGHDGILREIGSCIAKAKGQA